MSTCDTELFTEPDLVAMHLDKHPNATLEFCSYGYYTMQNAACKNLALID